MACFSLVIVPSKRLKSGLHLVRVAVAHNGNTRYIATDVMVGDGEFSNGRVVRRADAAAKNLILSKTLREYDLKLSEMDYVDGLTCAELVFLLTSRREGNPSTLGAMFDEYVSTARVKDSTKRLMKNCVSSLFACLGEDYPLKKLNYARVMQYEKYLRDQKNGDGTIRTKMAIFSKIVKYAVKSGYIKYEIGPFQHYKYPEEPVRDAWLDMEELKRLRDIPLDGPRAALRDYIMLSFYLGGINMADLMEMDFNEVRRSGVVKYKRTKTENLPKVNPFVEFSAPDEIWPLVERLISPDGKLGTTSQRKERLHTLISTNIKDLRKLTGIERLVVYSARKTFAQLAFELGVGTGVIDYILGHKLNKAGSSLYNYIAVKPEIATAAIRLVLDSLK